MRSRIFLVASRVFSTSLVSGSSNIDQLENFLLCRQMKIFMRMTPPELFSLQERIPLRLPKGDVDNGSSAGLQSC